MLKVDLPDKWLWIIFLGVICLVGGLGQTSYENPPGSHPEPLSDNLILTEGRILIQGNSLKAVVPPYHIRPIVYGTLLGCLEWHESKGDAEAVGKANECGVLQFTPATFQEFCVERYNFRDDIFDPEIQWACADRMISENWNLIWRWTTAKNCL